MNLNDSEFLEAANAWAPPVIATPEYRLYYNTDTNVGEFMSQEPATGSFIMIDKDTYEKYGAGQLKIKDGKAYVIPPKVNHSSQLVKSQTGYESVAGHAGVVLESGEDYSKTQHYDTKTD
jgi:hypothetical protein